MIDPREIKRHIASHAVWKVRLRTALGGNASDLNPNEIRPDDRCAFGKWLREQPTAVQASSHWREVSDLHTRFHHAAADVVTSIQRGKREEAERSVHLRGDFSRSTSDLTRSMKAWMDASAKA